MAWSAPVGIPVPTFGIDETYRIYDDPGKRTASGLPYQASAFGGYFTHYVDWTADGATDSDNAYGSILLPRKTVPYRLPAGSIVEVHDTLGSGYTKNAPYPNISYCHFSGAGTSELPIFIRGGSVVKFYQQTLRISGRYMVVEDFIFEDEECAFTTVYSYEWGLDYKDHLSFRGNEIYGYDVLNDGAVAMYAAADYSVVYDNNIHHNGYIEYGDGHDVHGVVVTTQVHDVWIVDNDIHHNDGDAIQIDDGPGGIGELGIYPYKIYIGRNKLHEDRENAVDLKYCGQVIVSQNEIYGYTLENRIFGIYETPQGVHGSDGSACLPSNEGCLSSWFLLNEIYNCVNAFRVDNEEYQTVDAHCYFLGNIIHDCVSYGLITWERSWLTFCYNIFYDLDLGFESYSGSDANEGQSIYKFHNNIFCKASDYWVCLGNALAASNATIENNIFYDGNGIKWGDDIYGTVATFKAGESGKGVGCIEDAPDFTDPENGDFSFEEGSPVETLNESSEVQDIFDDYEATYGIDISSDIRALFGYEAEQGNGTSGGVVILSL